MRKIILFTIVFLICPQLFSQNRTSFMPSSGKYIVSGWVKEEVTFPVTTYTNGKIKVNIQEIDLSATVLNTTSYVFNTSGVIIDGWQRIVGIIDIPEMNPNNTNSKIQIELLCSGTTADCFFDDIRFYPYNGNMKSFVYDEYTQRLMAELDENNYATFYEYDLEGGLVRVKKETERGVFTIQETRSNNPKN